MHNLVHRFYACMIRWTHFFIFYMQTTFTFTTNQSKKSTSNFWNGEKGDNMREHIKGNLLIF
jgi:hypothetical protein